MAIALKERRAIRNAETVAERPDGPRVPFIPYPTPLRTFITRADRRRHQHAGRYANAANRNATADAAEGIEPPSKNMQMLQSLPMRQPRKRATPTADILDEASKRITAMAAAQQMLYATDATSFQAGEFLEAVCQSAQQTLPPNVKIGARRRPANVQRCRHAACLDPQRLLTNAAKYGVNGSGDCASRRADKEIPLSSMWKTTVRVRSDTVARRSSGLGLVQGLADNCADNRGDEKPGHPLQLRFA
jgi:two-component sensor histidine kinase